MTTRDLELFAPTAIGLTIATWDELPKAPQLPRCELCGRALRSRESRDAGIGPCCAAKVGRAVTASARAARTPGAA